MSISHIRKPRLIDKINAKAKLAETEKKVEAPEPVKKVTKKKK